MNYTYDPEYIKAEQALRAAQIREQILGQRRVSRARRQRRLARWTRTTTDN